MATDGDIEGLLTSLRGEGEAVDTGSFALDPAKAREAMAKLAGASPHRYVLLIVQTMVQRGARTIAWEIGTREVRMTSDARGFTAAELEDVDAQFFAPDVMAPGLRDLAMSLTMATATGAATVELRNGHAGGAGVRLVREAGKADRIESIADAALGVELIVRARLRLGLVLRSFASVGDATQEHRLLAAHGGFAKGYLTVDGEPVPPWSFGPDAHAKQAVVLDGRRIGTVALLRGGGEGRVEVIRHLVHLATHPLPGADWRGVHACVDGSPLDTDAALADVVRDAAYERIVAAIGEARDRALVEFAATIGAGRLGPSDELHGLLLHRLARRLADGGRVDDQPIRAWVDTELWADLDDTRFTTRALLGWERIPYCNDPSELAAGTIPRGLPKPWCAALRLDPRHRASFEAIFGARAVDITKATLRLRNQIENLRRLHPHPDRLPPSPTAVAQLDFETAEFVGSVAWETGGDAGLWVRVVRGGIGWDPIELPLPSGPVHAVVSGPFALTEIEDDIARDERFADAVHAVLCAIDRVAQQVACSPRLGPDHVTRLLEHVLLMHNADALMGLVTGTGLSSEQATAMFARRGRPWVIDAGALASADDQTFASAFLFENELRAPLELRRIARAVAEGRRIHVRPHWDERDHRGVGVRGERLEAAVLRTLFGAERVEEER